MFHFPQWHVDEARQVTLTLSTSAFSVLLLLTVLVTMALPLKPACESSHQHNGLRERTGAGYSRQELSVGRPPFCSAVIWSCNWTTIPEQMASSPPPNPCSHYKKVLSKQPLRELLWNNKQSHCHVQNSDPALQEMKCSSVNNLPAQRPHTVSKPALALPVPRRPPVNRAWWNGSSLSRSLSGTEKTGQSKSWPDTVGKQGIPATGQMAMSSVSWK